MRKVWASTIHALRFWLSEWSLELCAIRLLNRCMGQRFEQRADASGAMANGQDDLEIANTQKTFLAARIYDATL